MQRRLKKLLQISGVVTGMAVVAFAVATLFNLNGNNAVAQDCSGNAIMKCGATTKSQFVSKARSLNGGINPDLATIYSAYGLNPGDYDRFVNEAKPATAYKDGRIVVDGRTVMTGAASIGRIQKSGDHAKSIGGKTYWEGSNQTAFASNSISAWVLFDGAGNVQFAVLGDCGNPFSGNKVPPPPTPVASCTGLTVAADNRTTFTASATAAASGGATISGYQFRLRTASGSLMQTQDVSTTGGAASTKFTVNSPGSYTIQAYVNTSLGQLTSDACAKPITVTAAPEAACQGLTVTALDRTNYKLAATATTANGATVQAYDFVVKNASGTAVSSPSVVTPSLAASANVVVEAAGTYTATVTVRTSEGVKSAAACAANFTVPEKPVPPVPSIKIEKNVDGVKAKQVAVGSPFTYNVTVTNDGKVDLQNVAVTDTPPAGVTLTGADKGMITANKWSFTIPSLKAGQSMTFALTAKVDAYVAGNLVNTACVDAPNVPGQPLCDTATVTVTPPETPVVPVLPNAGAGNVVPVVAAAVVLGALGYRFVIGQRLGRQN